MIPKPSELPGEGYAPRYKCLECGDVDFLDDRDAWDWDTLVFNLMALQLTNPWEEVLTCGRCGSSRVEVAYVAIQHDEGPDTLLDPKYWRDAVTKLVEEERIKSREPGRRSHEV